MEVSRKHGGNPLSTKGPAQGPVPQKSGGHFGSISCPATALGLDLAKKVVAHEKRIPVGRWGEVGVGGLLT